jgi:hypothetical protein
MNTTSFQNGNNRNDKPVNRRKIGPTRRSVSGHHMFRGIEQIDYESTLERDFVVRQEFFGSVFTVVSQPITIAWKDQNGREYPYTPDYLVVYRTVSSEWKDQSRAMYVEVKPKSEWQQNWRRWSFKWKAMRRVAINEGCTFSIYDEDRIRNDAVFRNITFLTRYKRMQFDPLDSKRILEFVSEFSAATVQEIVDHNFDGQYRAQGLANVWHLLATKQLTCDIHDPLQNGSQVWVDEQEWSRE